MFSNSYITAVAIQGIICILIFFLFRDNFKSRLSFIVFSSILLPVPIGFLYRPIYIFDLIGLVYLIRVGFGSKYNFIFKIKIIKSFAMPLVVFLLAAPILSTLLYVSHDFLQVKSSIFEHIYRGTLIIFLLRFCVIQMYINPQSINKLIFHIMVVWNMLLFVALLQAGSFIDTNFTVKSNNQLNSEFLVGFMGLDKPQIALFCVTIFNIALYFPACNRRKDLARYFTLIGSFIICLMIGSRQGLFFIGISMLLSLIVFGRSFKRSLVNILILTLLVVVYGWLPEKFNSGYEKLLSETSDSIFQSSNKNTLQSVLEVRDPRFFESIAFLFSGSPNIIVGSGVGTEQSGYFETSDGFLVDDASSVRTYFEGEIFRIIWALGFFGVLVYLLLIYKAARFINGTQYIFNFGNFSAYRNMFFSQLIITFLYSFGQFGLFTMNVSNTPYVYFIWSLFALFMGLFVSINYSSKFKCAGV